MVVSPRTTMWGPVHDLRGIATVTLPPDIYGYSVRAHDQGCHPARDAGSSSWYKRNNNGDSLPQIFLDTASKRGMTKGVIPHSDAGSRKVNLTGNLVGVTRCRIQVRHDRSAKPSGLWEKAERKMTEKDEQGKKMFEPKRISRRARSCIASRTAATERARRVLFPRTSQSFFSFRTSAGSFLLASLFFCGKRKGEIQDARSVRPYWPGRYCRLFSLGINSGYILDTASRTVSPRT